MKPTKLHVPMTWTREPPTVPGYYWLLEEADPRKLEPTIILLYDASDHGGTIACETLAGHGCLNTPGEEYPDAEWYGPLEPPP